MFIIKYLKSLTFIFIGLLLTTLIITLISYFNIFGTKIIKILEYLLIIISLFIGGVYIGKRSSNKGYIEGFKIGLITISILFIIGYLVLSKEINYKSLIYYLIIVISSILGSIIGINKKLRNNP